ncbi:hypothetical protein [Neptuniibacter sp.]|uniref:hypothetical protein n=1 Tax=Neptuniibacter sp. TaxID=1962643 RepID=UPI00261D2675|nr:hypothetical protein [Neptuniibacter sp.]MCP4596729.1 hypothetical protein [Neptuniibacter sp.]
MQVKLSQLHKAIAALLMLFFVVYCSVGVCTNMLASSMPPLTPTTAESAHVHHHHMEGSGSVNHRRGIVKSLEVVSGVSTRLLTQCLRWIHHRAFSLPIW